MQYTQPGFSHYGQPIAFNTPFQFNGYPEVIGEGNVTSVMSPDGSMQLLFLPTMQWWRPYQCNINAGNMNNSSWNPTGAWFIRSVFSPLQSMPYQPQPFQAPSGLSFPKTYSSNCCISKQKPPPSFELKFHNDICTSTSDIHYFYPSLRPDDWLQNPKGCVSIQDVPMATSSGGHYTVICKRPCKCAPMDEAENTVIAECNYAQTQSSETDQSETDCCRHKDKKNKSRKEKKTKSKKKNLVICECKKTQRETKDKYVTTFADQACGYVAEGRETQTAADGKGNETQTDCGVATKLFQADDCLQNPKGCASVQDAMATSSGCHYAVISTRPCKRAPMDEAENTVIAECSYAQKQSSETDQSEIDYSHKYKKDKSRKYKKTKPTSEKGIKIKSSETFTGFCEVLKLNCGSDTE